MLCTSSVHPVFILCKMADVCPKVKRLDITPKGFCVLPTQPAGKERPETSVLQIRGSRLYSLFAVPHKILQWDLKLHK
jgi:hypothetical protein